MPDDTPRRVAGEMEQTGYRVSRAVRQELVLAMNYEDVRSIQAVIDIAVDQYLSKLRRRPRFAASLRDAEDYRREQRGES